MEEITQQQAPVATKTAAKITKEERSKIMSEAATRRWAKAKRAKAKAAKAPPAPARGKKRPTAPREFTSALKTAEKRLASAILERAKAAATYAVLSAEIPSLQRLIVALKNPLGVMPEVAPNPYYSAPGYANYGAATPPTLEEIVGDQPLMYQNPPRVDIPAQPQPIPVIPVPQALHPANTQAQSRAGGGAIGVPLDPEEGQVEDEDQFLKDSAVAGGAWH
jgi:hypothetical protein